MNKVSRRKVIKAAIRQAKKYKRPVYIFECKDTRQKFYYHLSLCDGVEAIVEVNPGDKITDHLEYLQ